MRRRRTPLVSQFLENVSRGVLADYQKLVREHVRGRHGIYALYRRDKLYYVGLAKDLRNRLTAHLRDRHAQSWDRFSVYLTINDTHMKELESLLLRIVQPKGNRMGGKFANAENLRLVFGQRIRAEQRAELDELLGQRRRAKQSSAAKVLKSVNGRVPVLAKFPKRPRLLRGRYKGERYTARVLKDGRIRHDGKDFNSPSLAAIAATGGAARNGWWFWQYERAPGEWVRLRELKR
jgi:predicted GIY-YIG superfamily endonuclease